MCADLFHYGHVLFLKRVKQFGDILLVGIHNDETIMSYKRKPVMNMKERIMVVESCKYVDKIIPNAPLYITKDYLNKYNIDKVVTVNRSKEEIKKMYEVPYNENILEQIPYTYGISTTDIIQRILDNSKDNK